jgi:DNA-binding response OmpR family regulator
MKILLVEDNIDIATNIGLFFEDTGHQVDFAYNGKHGLTLAVEHNFDIIILDLMLPGMDGISVCKALKEKHKIESAIIMLTARDTLDDKLLGFEAGADDYLVKPFSLLELAARVNVLYKRGSASSDTFLLQVADLKLNRQEHTVLRDGQPIKLKPVNFRILEFLLINQHRVVPQHEIIDHVWTRSPPQGDPLRVHIHNIRQKIDKPFTHKLLHTIHGVGYRLYDSTPA